MWHQWYYFNFTKLREYFCVQRKIKLQLFLHFISSTSPWCHFGEYTYINNVCNLCTWICCLRSDQSANNVSAYICCIDCLVQWIRSKMGPGCRQGILTMSLLRFWALIVLGSLLSMGGPESSQNSSKYMNLSSEDERRFYRFGTTWGWVTTSFSFLDELSL